MRSALLSIATLCCGIVAMTLAAGPANAQATRTWVSGVGDDANPCSRTAPCKTFAGAISKTAAGGEIDVLDPGGFGAVTITKSISIYNDGVGEAGVLVSGTNGIVINAAATDVINLSGLTIDGLNTSLNGVFILSARQVTIQNCVIQEFGNGTPGLAGVNVQTSGGNVNIHIQDSTIINNTAGVDIKPGGGGTAKVTVDRSRIANNSGVGFRTDGTGGGGAITVSLHESVVSNNNGNGINAVSGSGATTNVNIMRSVISNNGGNGIQSNQTNGGTAIVAVGSSIISSNQQNLNAVGGGALLSYQTNQVLNSINGVGGFSGNAALQ